MKRAARLQAALFDHTGPHFRYEEAGNTDGDSEVQPTARFVPSRRARRKCSNS